MMKNLKIELWKAFHGKAFWTALMVGIGIVLYDVYENFKRVSEYISRTEFHSGTESSNLFVRWIGINMDTLGYMLFFFVIPILAALPFGWSFHMERTSGYNCQIVSRCSYRSWLWSKYIATFLTGGMVIAIPLFLNLMANALVCPASMPQAGSLLTPIGATSFASVLYYTYPWLYSFLSLFLDFIWGGAIACICLPLSWMFRKKALIVLSPFFLLVAFEFFIQVVTNKFILEVEISPMALMHIVTLSKNPGWIILLVLLILITIPLAVFLWKGLKNENL